MLDEKHRELYERLGPDLRAIRDYLALAFTDPTATHYRVTAAIAEMFMACDGIAGIKYPSVAKDARVDNLALLPDFVRSGLRLTEANVVFIDKVDEDGIGGSVVARLSSVNDGVLTWEYVGEGSTTLKPGEGVAMEIKPGDRKRLQNAGRLGIDGRTYDVFPGYSIELVDGEVVVLDLQNRRVPPLD